MFVLVLIVFDTDYIVVAGVCVCVCDAVVEDVAVAVAVAVVLVVAPILRGTRRTDEGRGHRIVCNVQARRSVVVFVRGACFPEIVHVCFVLGCAVAVGKREGRGSSTRNRIHGDSSRSGSKGGTSRGCAVRNESAESSRKPVLTIPGSNGCTRSNSTNWSGWIDVHLHRNPRVVYGIGAEMRRRNERSVCCAVCCIGNNVSVLVLVLMLVLQLLLLQLLGSRTDSPNIHGGSTGAARTTRY
mmetsp:Transcript_3041/g.6540  ORF Transcript_3041/g.6540 Transcript_3041/m.6540 type:complete len:241 (+) Transcript_3041:2926-3648(+)